MRMLFHRQSVHSSLAASGSSGILTAGSGGLPSGSFQTNSRPPAHIGRPRPGARRFGRALGVGHQLAAAVAAPAPVVERAGDLVALDGALRQVAAHVPAVAVQDLDVAVRVGENHQLGAERLNRVRFAVQEFLRDAQAVPASGVPGRQGAGIDLPDADRFCRRYSPGHLQLTSPPTRTRYSFRSDLAQ